MMKTIAVFGDEQKNEFLLNVTRILTLLDVKFQFVTEETISTIKHFDYIILLNDASLTKISLNCGYCFIDMDQNQGDSIEVYGNIIAFGFGGKNTVTISSVENENGGFVYCLQRYLNINAFRMLEPQEIPINVEFHKEQELYPYMVCITIALIEGLSNAEIEERLALRCYMKNL